MKKSHHHIKKSKVTVQNNTIIAQETIIRELKQTTQFINKVNLMFTIISIISTSITILTPLYNFLNEKMIEKQEQGNLKNEIKNRADCLSCFGNESCNPNQIKQASSAITGFNFANQYYQNKENETLSLPYLINEYKIIKGPVSKDSITYYINECENKIEDYQSVKSDSFQKSATESIKENEMYARCKIAWKMTRHI